MISYFQKNRIIAFSIIILLIVNVILLGFLWFGSFFKPPHNPERLRNFIVDELGFDDRQIIIFDKLKEDHRAKMRATKGEIQMAKEELLKLLLENDLDKELYNTKMDGLLDIVKKQEDITFNHFQQVRGICSEKQKKRFDSLIKEIIQIMTPPK